MKITPKIIVFFGKIFRADCEANTWVLCLSVRRQKIVFDEREGSGHYYFGSDEGFHDWPGVIYLYWLNSMQQARSLPRNRRRAWLVY